MILPAHIVKTKLYIDKEWDEISDHNLNEVMEKLFSISIPFKLGCVIITAILLLFFNISIIRKIWVQPKLLKRTLKKSVQENSTKILTKNGEKLEQCYEENAKTVGKSIERDG